MPTASAPITTITIVRAPLARPRSLSRRASSGVSTDASVAPRRVMTARRPRRAELTHALVRADDARDGSFHEVASLHTARDRDRSVDALDVAQCLGVGWCRGRLVLRHGSRVSKTDHGPVFGHSASPARVSTTCRRRVRAARRFRARARQTRRA